jgi:hypothetical protein
MNEDAEDLLRDRHARGEREEKSLDRELFELSSGHDRRARARGVVCREEELSSAPSSALKEAYLGGDCARYERAKMRGEG